MPFDTPVTKPVAEIVALPLLAFQVPPETVSTSVSVEPVHKCLKPVMIPGLGTDLTMNGKVCTHAPSVYVMVAIPGLRAVTKPPALIEEIAAFDELQVPPKDKSESNVVLPAQSESVPVIAAIAPLTTTLDVIAVTLHPDAFVAVSV